MVSNKSGGGIKIANNLITTEEGFVLDARQGKALDEKIAEQQKTLNDYILGTLLPFKGKMPTDADFNNYKARGWYENSGTNQGQVNVPDNGDNGVLLVLGDEYYHVRQIWIGSFSMKFKTRTYNGIWSEWKSFVLE